MGNDTVGWGILGTGGSARRFAEGLQSSTTGRLVAVGSRSHAAANQFILSHPNAKPVGDYASLLTDPDVKVVYVALPHPMHAEWAIRAAEAGKHVLCEKPAGLNHAELQAMLEAAAEHRVFFMEAYMYRCHPQTARLVQLIKEGAIGELRLIQARFSFRIPFDRQSRSLNRELGGGGILDVGGYTTSMARLLAGAAGGEPFAEPLEFTGYGQLGPASGVDEYAVGMLKFRGGIFAQVSCGVQLNAENDLRLYGTEGSIRVPSPWFCGATEGAIKLFLQRNTEAAREIVIEAEKDLYAYEADIVAENLDRGEAPAMSWRDSLGNLAIQDRWRQAVGVRYEPEKGENMRTTIAGRPLRRRNDIRFPHAKIRGVMPLASRLVLGTMFEGAIALERHAFNLLDDFYERGGNAFDTAYVYAGGEGERILGKWLRNRGVRKEVVILGKGAHPPYCRPEAVNRQLTESLDRLQTDYVDIYMLHRDDPGVPVSEWVDAMNEAVHAGRARSLGVSNWTIERIEAANAYAQKRGLVELFSVSNNFSLARMIAPVWNGCVSSSDLRWRLWLAAHQTCLFAWSSQARGFFAPGVVLDASGDPEMRRCWLSEDNLLRRKRASEVAAKYGVAPINIALAYVLAQRFPTFALFGPRTLSEVRTTLPGLGITLTSDEVKWLNLES